MPNNPFVSLVLVMLNEEHSCVVARYAEDGSRQGGRCSACCRIRDAAMTQNSDSQGMDSVTWVPSQATTSRHAILRVLWGPLSCRKAVIAPNQVLQVGRAESMGLSVAHDGQMADAHFELSWSGSQGWLKSLQGPSATLLEGQPVEQGEIFNGSWVRAGQTDFSVYFERTTPPPPPEQPDPPELLTRKAQALELLRNQKAPLYAVLDAAQNRRIRELLNESVEESRSLYEGPQGDVLADVAPYIVELRPGSELLELLVQEGWGRSWGVYLTCTRTLMEVRRHLRRFLMVDIEKGRQRAYFRFYDPRALSQWLPVSTPAQTRALTGPMECILYEDVQGNILRVDGAADIVGVESIEVFKAQLEAMTAAKMNKFIQRTSARLVRFFPECRHMSRDYLHNIIHQGIRQARVHGMESGQHIAKYIGLMIILGNDFAEEGGNVALGGSNPGRQKYACRGKTISPVLESPRRQVALNASA